MIFALRLVVPGQAQSLQPMTMNHQAPRQVFHDLKEAPSVITDTWIVRACSLIQLIIRLARRHHGSKEEQKRRSGLFWYELVATLSSFVANEALG